MPGQLDKTRKRGILWGYPSKEDVVNRDATGNLQTKPERGSQVPGITYHSSRRSSDRRRSYIVVNSRVSYIDSQQHNSRTRTGQAFPNRSGEQYGYGPAV